VKLEYVLMVHLDDLILILVVPFAVIVNIVHMIHEYVLQVADDEILQNIILSLLQQVGVVLVLSLNDNSLDGHEDHVI
jgi:hypothetical protein